MFFMDPYDTITRWKPTSGREPINFYWKLNLLLGASELKYIFYQYLNTDFQLHRFEKLWIWSDQKHLNIKHALWIQEYKTYKVAQ